MNNEETWSNDGVEMCLALSDDEQKTGEWSLLNEVSSETENLTYIVNSQRERTVCEYGMSFVYPRNANISRTEKCVIMK